MAAEKKFENKIKTFLKEHECWFLKYWAGSSLKGKTFTKEGIPDIIACCNGKFIAIEVKAPNGKPKPLQLWNLKKIDEAGGFAILLYPDQWEVFKNFIKCIQVNDVNMNYNYSLLKRIIIEWDEKLKKEGDAY